MTITPETYLALSMDVYNRGYGNADSPDLTQWFTPNTSGPTPVI